MEACAEQYNSSSLGEGDCDEYYDNLTCWPPTHAGNTSVLICPIMYDPFGLKTVSLHCSENGTWQNTTPPKYDECGEPSMLTLKLANITYGISLAACVLAILIFSFCRTLWCKRNYIHWHLITSFVLNIFFYFMVYLQIHKEWHIPVIREISSIMVHYTVMAMYFWMFVEGCYLHALVALAFKIEVDNIHFLWFCLIGWGLPAVFVFTWTIIKTIKEKESFINQGDGNLESTLLIILPICIVLVLNSLFLLNIVRILMSKLRQSSGCEGEWKQYRRTARATLVLVILLGVTYAFPIFLFTLLQTFLPGTVLFAIAVINSIATGLQGALVALIYVFMNAEVKIVLARRFRRTFGNSLCPTRQSSTPATSYSHVDQSASYRIQPVVNNNRPKPQSTPHPNGDVAIGLNDIKIEESVMKPLNGAAREEVSPLLTENVQVNENGSKIVHDTEANTQEQLKTGTDV